MWGDIEALDPNTEEEWYNYIFAESDGEGGYYISKYNGEVYTKGEDDNILRGSNDYYYANTLALNDDCVKWYYGGAWTLPTLDDISRLYEIADMSFETVNNIECVKLTSTINGNVLYFPQNIRCWTNYCDNSYNALSYGVNSKPRSAETQYEIFGCTGEEKCRLRAARGVIGHYVYSQIPK